ncbi:Nitrogen assimilation transcription factor nit-4 [Vanrija pseudolonga]|uniref:Nitrogen assimilation transcription factor nit-4 n=1 Tax=Vanrija pseudolonga TaxID=143232 RepID=A0AAF0Y560_9TREE|nr:Nitrogen assimilation transcription factor nit-4 [Vanrija pseudolonga]
MPADPSPSSSSNAAKQRRRHNVTQACYNCRQRKKKCDAVTPTCGTCAALKDECVWGEREDWRKPLSRAETNGLRAKVDQLEELTKHYREQIESLQAQVYAHRRDGQASSSGPPSGAAFQSVNSGITGIGGTTASDPPSVGTDGRPRRPSAKATLHDPQEDVDGMVIEDPRGQVRFHNPSSAFRHALRNPLPDAPPGASPIASTLESAPRLNNHDDPQRFARFLPNVYLTKAQHDRAVDHCFRYFTSFGQRATPHLFYRDMEIALSLDNIEDLPLLTPNYSPLLHNVIISVGLAYADEEHLHASQTRRIFYQEGTKHLEREAASPSLATVAALALRSSFSSTVGDYSIGWVYFGLASRLVYALGLHIDTSKLVAQGKLNQETYVQRNVTFWSTFCQEEMWAVYIGRMPLMLADYTVGPPEADAATDDTPWTWPPGPYGHLPPQKSWLSTCFVHTTGLFKIATEITHTVYSSGVNRSLLVQNGTVDRLSQALEDWGQTLRSEPALDLTQSTPPLPHILLLHIGLEWVNVLLFQPFSQVSARGAAQDLAIANIAMTRCHQSALKIDELGQLYHATHGMRFTPPTMAQMQYTAGTSFVLAAAQARNAAQAADDLERARRALFYLKEIGLTWGAGRQKESILSEIIAELEEKAANPNPSDENAVPQDTLLGLSQEVQTDDSTLSLAPEPSSAVAGLDTNWVGADGSLDDFVQSLLTQYVLPLGGEVDLMALLQPPQQIL